MRLAALKYSTLTTTLLIKSISSPPEDINFICQLKTVCVRRKEDFLCQRSTFLWCSVLLSIVFLSPFLKKRQESKEVVFPFDFIMLVT